MTRQHKTIRIAEEVAKIDDKIDDVLDEAEDLDEDSEAYEEKEVKFQALSIKKDNLENFAEDLHSDSFEVRELSFGEVMHVRDEVMAHSTQDNPREGLYQVKVLDKAVEDSPEEMPDEPKDWNPMIAELIYDRVDEMNTGVSEEKLGNFSLQDAMENR